MEECMHKNYKDFKLICDSTVDLQLGLFNKIDHLNHALEQLAEFEQQHLMAKQQVEQVL